MPSRTPAAPHPIEANRDGCSPEGISVRINSADLNTFILSIYYTMLAVQKGGLDNGWEALNPFSRCPAPAAGQSLSIACGVLRPPWRAAFPNSSGIIMARMPSVRRARFPPPSELQDAIDDEVDRSWAMIGLLQGLASEREPIRAT